MSLVSSLAAFGLRQLLGDGIENVGQAVIGLFRDHSQTLPKAIQRAQERTWQALAVALAGDGLLDRVRVFFASGDDKGVREQIATFLRGTSNSFAGSPAAFRDACLDELRRLRKAKLTLDEAEIARQAAGFRRHADSQGLVDEARRTVEEVAATLSHDYPNLAKLLRTPTPAGPPLLAAAFSYFFRREVETDEELAHGLFFDGLRQLTASQAKAFAEVGKALTTLGDRFEQLERIEGVAVQTHGAVLSLQAEMQRLTCLHLADAGEIRSLLEQVQQHLAHLGMQQGEVRPQHSFSIRGDDERRAVKVLLERFRRLPGEEQRQVPALLNGLGKLQVGAGDFGGASQTFHEVVRNLADPAGLAEGFFNAYRAALEERKWDAALEAIRQAASLDPGRFAPFPLHRYQPRRILGAGGFGTAVLCLDRHFDEEVVVKILHATDLAEVFREARVLRKLSHPAVISVRDCEYADPAGQARPYIVMDYFAGVSLEAFVREHGPLPVLDLLGIARPVAEGMRAAHFRGVFHRDLKPENILVRKEGADWVVKVVDFGLALRRQAEETVLGRSVAGTVQYAHPEQLGRLPGVKVGPYSDVYAYGKTCCYALFRTTEPRRRQWASIPEALADLLEKCIEHELELRLPDFGRVLEVLESLDPGRAFLREQGVEVGAVEREEPCQDDQPRPQEVEEQQAPALPEPVPSRLAEARECLSRAKALRDVDLKQAINEATEAIRLEPSFAEAYAWRGEVYEKEGDTDAAIADWVEAVRLDVKLDEAVIPSLVLAYSRRGGQLESYGDYQQAIHDYTEVIRRDPTLAEEFRPRLAKAYASRGHAVNDDSLMGHDFDTPIECFTEAALLEPKWTEDLVAAYIDRADDLARESCFEDALADYNEALRLDSGLAKDGDFCMKRARAAAGEADQEDEEDEEDIDDDDCDEFPEEDFEEDSNGDGDCREALHNAATALDDQDLEGAEDWLSRYEELREDGRREPIGGDKRCRRLRALIRKEEAKYDSGVDLTDDE